MAQANSVPSPIFNPITGASPDRPTKRQYRDRRYFIGGSDARIIMGDDEAALLRLWREKRGEVEPEDLSGNLIVQLGLATEDLNRRWYEANTSQVITDTVRVVDMSGSNSWAEFAGLFRSTRQAFLEHERSKTELKALMPEDAKGGDRERRPRQAIKIRRHQL